MEVLAGLNIRVLSTSSRKCTVSAIDNHEILGLDLVQCAALVQTNHGIFNLIMNDYVYYGRGHSIHSSGQLEWYTNIVDNKSVQAGGLIQFPPEMDENWVRYGLAKLGQISRLPN